MLLRKLRDCNNGLLNVASAVGPQKLLSSERRALIYRRLITSIERDFLFPRARARCRCSCELGQFRRLHNKRVSLDNGPGTLRG